MLLARALALALAVSAARAQAPTAFCTAGTSTAGCAPSISANVQPNTANNAGCVIAVQGVEGQRSGLIFYGVDNMGFTPQPWAVGSSSLLCVKPPTRRASGALNSGGVAGQCNGAFALDWDAFAAANPATLGAPWIAGDKLFAQAWQRDPQAIGNANLSNALELTLRHPACSVSISGMVVIPAGSFLMGSNATSGPPYFADYGEQPVHQVTLTYCFWMGAREVTQAEYAALMGVNPSWFPGPNQPVETVSWFDARAYCTALTAQQAALGAVPPGYEYRLPTEAEWEYACRAGTTTEFSVGAALLCNQAEFFYSHHAGFGCNSNGPVAVGSYAPNAWGLYDMHGNVREWCLDSYWFYQADPLVDPFATGGANRVLRGGAWTATSSGCRSAFRLGKSPGEAFNDRGFRVVLAPILAP